MRSKVTIFKKATLSSSVLSAAVLSSFFGLNTTAFARATDLDNNAWQFMTESPDVQITPDAPKSYQLAWGAMTRPWTRNFVLQELTKDTPNLPITKMGAEVKALPFSPMDGSTNDTRNPFWITPNDFFTGLRLLLPPAAPGPIPLVPAQDQTWFDDMIAQGNAPDVFMIGGHHVISEGFHNDPETMFMYTPTLLETLKSNPKAREYFDHVKVAILFGCNTLTDLEPRAADGSFLSTEQIAAQYNSGDDGIAAMIGSSDKTNTLEFYRSRLAREYGADADKYEYTRNASAERCTGTADAPYLNCSITNLERIMPDYGLTDGTHRYNEALIEKSIFRNAYLVIGFNSASPSEETRVNIFKTAMANAYKKLNQGLDESDSDYVHNILREIIDDATPKARRAAIIQFLRTEWTKATYAMNRNRPSGSITPALPELDKNGVFNVRVSADSPLFAPYEAR